MLQKGIKCIKENSESYLIVFVNIHVITWSISTNSPKTPENKTKVYALLALIVSVKDGSFAHLFFLEWQFWGATECLRNSLPSYYVFLHWSSHVQELLRREVSRSRGGIPLMYVIVVAVVGIILGFLLKKTWPNIVASHSGPVMFPPSGKWYVKNQKKNECVIA